MKRVRAALVLLLFLLAEPNLALSQATGATSGATALAKKGASKGKKSKKKKVNATKTAKKQPLQPETDPEPPDDNYHPEVLGSAVAKSKKARTAQHEKRAGSQTISPPLASPSPTPTPVTANEDRKK